MKKLVDIMDSLIYAEDRRKCILGSPAAITTNLCNVPADEIAKELKKFMQLFQEEGK